MTYFSTSLFKKATPSQINDKKGKTLFFNIEATKKYRKCPALQQQFYCLDSKRPLIGFVRVCVCVDGCVSVRVV